jgi:hypothetical protein
MTGLGPAIQTPPVTLISSPRPQQCEEIGAMGRPRLDGRVKPGHDVEMARPAFMNSPV